MPDQTAPQLSQWLTVKQVAREIAASTSFVRKAIACRKLAAVNLSLGSQRAEWRVSRQALTEYLRAAAVPQESQQ